MKKQQDTRNVRREYVQGQLAKKNLDQDPIRQFGHWMNDAVEAKIKDPTCMTLATCGEDGMPSARIVLLKHHDKSGFCWYTHYQSAKGIQIQDNPKASLLFYWHDLDRQVRVSGLVEKLPVEISDRYFDTRPKESRISAIVSPQSKPIESREALLQQVEQQTLISENTAIVRPEFWGGYLLKPSEFEFWQGREDRLHDRFRYQKADNIWKIERLAP
ncbi:MAG: pyridoxamine 5'-phosphate oxidase [Pseudomonadales bacterium]|nr:pyridoxamine 5'-phosphate oxidase [Pseudomonadales bacterium]